jgi:hypothetical protein
MGRRRADPGQPTAGSTAILIFGVLVAAPGGIVELIGSEQNVIRHASDPHLLDVVFGLSALTGFLITGGWGVWTMRRNRRLIRAASNPADAATGRPGRAWIVTGATVAALILLRILGGPVAMAAGILGLFIGAAVLFEIALFWVIGKRLTRRRGRSPS